VATPRAVAPADVRARVGQPDAMIEAKVLDHLDPTTRRFVAHAPFVAMATADADGRADCTPRGDYPGFVKVLDDRTVALPDRPGNRRADSFSNLAENDGVGLLFLVPGVRETLRINGAGWVTDDEDVLARMQVEGRTPQLAIVVRVAEVFFHCGRALVRSRLWDPESRRLAEEFPSAGEMVAEQMGQARFAELGLSPEAVDAGLESAYRKLY
jgi:uncharacterized protein